MQNIGIRKKILYGIYYIIKIIINKIYVIFIKLIRFKI